MATLEVPPKEKLLVGAAAAAVLSVVLPNWNVDPDDPLEVVLLAPPEAEPN